MQRHSEASDGISYCAFHKVSAKLPSLSWPAACNSRCRAQATEIPDCALILWVCLTSQLKALSKKAKCFLITQLILLYLLSENRKVCGTTPLPSNPKSLCQESEISVPHRCHLIQTAKHVGITLIFTFQGAERCKAHSNEEKCGSHIAHCAILETQIEGLSLLKQKATPLSLNELLCSWKAYQSSSDDGQPNGSGCGDGSKIQAAAGKTSHLSRVSLKEKGRKHKVCRRVFL